MTYKISKNYFMTYNYAPNNFMTYQFPPGPGYQYFMTTPLQMGLKIQEHLRDVKYLMLFQQIGGSKRGQLYGRIKIVPHFFSRDTQR